MTVRWSSSSKRQFLKFENCILTVNTPEVQPHLARVHAAGIARGITLDPEIAKGLACGLSIDAALRAKDYHGELLAHPLGVIARALGLDLADVRAVGDA
jgi:hypothetical protein